MLCYVRRKNIQTLHPSHTHHHHHHHHHHHQVAEDAEENERERKTPDSQFPLQHPPTAAKAKAEHAENGEDQHPRGDYYYDEGAYPYQQHAARAQ